MLGYLALLPLHQAVATSASFSHDSHSLTREYHLSPFPQPKLEATFQRSHARYPID